jgi:hypothetical protein
MAITESLKKLQLKFVFRKDAEIGGNKFTLQVLSLKEEQRTQALPDEGVDGIAFFNNMQKVMLSSAIRAVDGEEIPDIVEVDGADGKKSTKERAIYVREILEGLPAPVIENLFQVYVDMREQKENEINASLTYSWYKTPQQRDEDRRKKEQEAAKAREEEEQRRQEAAATKAQGGSKASDVPSPDADINLQKLPSDFSDDKEAKTT